MDAIATWSSSDRAELFEVAAEQMAIGELILEKDFWVCWVLKQLFEHSALRECFLFKGGTSLSKAYGLIQRFSEDIDLIVRYEVLGYTGNPDLFADRSKTQQAKLNAEVLTACRAYIGDTLRPLLQEHFCHRLGERDTWTLEVDPDQPDTLLFEYPRSVGKSSAYIATQVRLEIGPHAALLPSEPVTIHSYAAQQVPSAFHQGGVQVPTIRPERTFWEKATILHAECHRPRGKALGLQYSRHYYDTAMMARRGDLCERCLHDIALLDQVRAHKQRFYPSGWAHYESAQPGTLRLIPHDGDHLRALRRDYELMRPMFFGEPPSFQAIMDELRELEDRINGRSSGWRDGR